MKQRLKTFLIWGLLLGLFAAFVARQRKPEPLHYRSFATFERDLRDGRINEVQVAENVITVTRRDTGERYRTLGVIDDELMRTLSNSGIVVRPEDGLETSDATDILFQIGMPLIVVVAVVLFLFSRLKSGTSNISELSKSHAKVASEGSDVTFADVGGCVEAKDQFGDVIDFLKNPEGWVDAGARVPRGVLLEGPPGCGKTLLARAVAGETNARFYFIAASEFVEMFVGVGAARIRDMFETAAKQLPSVIFIDELDAVGRRRGSGIGAAHDEREQTLNQLLVCMDGFQNNDQVVVIAATNRPDVLDQALLRPGRFDRRIKIATRRREERLEILKIHARNKRLANDVSLRELADRTDGMNGAELEGLMNEAAILAIRRSRTENGAPASIHWSDLEQAMQSAASQSRVFNKLDLVLIESASQLAEPTGKVVARLTLADDMLVEGEVIWADATFIKMRDVDDDSEMIVPKSQIQKIERLEGTEVADSADLVTDAWSRKSPDLLG